MNDLTGSVLYSVTEQLLKEVEHSYKSTGRLTDEILSALQFVFQTTLLPALDLVDQRNVTRLSSPSGRIIYQVVGSSGTPYTCLATSIYCSCPAYRFSVLLKQDHIMCKHTLAIRLAITMDLCKELKVSNQELVKAITSID
ncbi:zinc finger SWIM domain-containing protein 7-like isoform X2 [Mizuhopecten yessoensis]|uniref:Zinc finger SWIM domain-containing protein 7 n=1 Tax=Mizuhopecten yessoensis TaxID=6573 RepID=A0A210R4P3_MIZYE|nr:zinc finger SWIM domain-containing protein 7-like isoform X2 [Mizuhopecten yessoensis]OWF55989.1 Zinc finger SWIM domain-containing protein 7 [Mizuhopecten yessoensis]